MPSVAKQFTMRFIKKEQLKNDVFSFSFDREERGLTFLPGHYVQMTLPHENSDERGSSRYFTISSSPTEKDYLTITTRVGKSSFKKALFGLQPGTKVQLFGPMGTFLLPV